MRKASKNKGLSLLEMMMVLAIVSILSWLGLAAWKDWRVEHQQRIAVAQLQQTLLFAKQVALAKREQVTVCAVASDQACGTDWSKGIFVFLDPENHAQPRPDALLVRVPAFAGDVALSWHGWLGHTYIRFAEDGLPHSYHGSFLLGAKDKQKPVLILNNVGRVRNVNEETA